MLYSVLKIVHVFSACVVIGYLIYDVFIFSILNKKLDSIKAIKKLLMRRSITMLGGSFLLLIASGALMSKNYFDGKIDSGIEVMLSLKILCVGLLFLFAPISIIFRNFKKPDPFKEYYHHIALLLCVCALVLGNLLFVF